MSPLDILSIFLQICEGVKAFHEAKPKPLAHRDLKTANIVLNDDGIPIIMDLGMLNFIILIFSNYKFLSLNTKNFFRFCSNCQSSSMWYSSCTDFTRFSS